MGRWVQCSCGSAAYYAALYSMQCRRNPYELGVGVGSAFEAAPDGTAAADGVAELRPQRVRFGAPLRRDAAALVNEVSFELRCTPALASF